MKICSIEGCDRKHEAHGLCGTHYRKAKTRGEINYKACSIENCNRSAITKSLCERHYKRLLKFGDARAPLKDKAIRNSISDFIKQVCRFDEDRCFFWPYGRHTAGYGIYGKGKLVHRYVCEEANGPPPFDKAQAIHTCGKGHEGCVSPKHLRWGTNSENQSDRIVHNTHHRGERHKLSKLKEADVLLAKEAFNCLEGRQIRKLFFEEFAAKHEISFRYAKFIAGTSKRRNWNWLEGTQ